MNAHLLLEIFILFTCLYSKMYKNLVILFYMKMLKIEKVKLQNPQIHYKWVWITYLKLNVIEILICIHNYLSSKEQRKFLLCVMENINKEVT